MRIWILLAVLGCQSARKERPAAVTDEMFAVMERDVAVVRKLARELDATKGDCKAAAQVIRDNSAAVATAAKDSRRHKALSKDDPAVKEWINATYRTRDNLAAEATLKRVAKECASDPNYQAAMAQQQAANGG